MPRLARLSVITLALLASPALALECPVPAIDDDASSEAIAKILPAGVDLQAPEALQSAVYDLRQAGIADDTILDNLIATYCSSVAAEQGLTDEEKTQEVQAFSTEANKAVFGSAQ